MGVVLKTPAQVEKMYRAGQLLGSILDEIEAMVAPGLSTADLDRRAEELIDAAGARGAFKGYHGFPAVLCTSVNEAVVHGIPSAEQVLQEGDIVSVDCGVVLEGYFADSARTLSVGTIDEESQRLLEVTKLALERAIAHCKVGGRLSNIGAAVQRTVESAKFSVVRDFSGHGIGRALHEDPSVRNYGKIGRGMKLRPGLVLAIEPMVNAGSHHCVTLEDDWTVVTRDRKRSAHFEHTVAITEDGPWVLTQRA